MIQVLGVGLIPRGRGIAPRKDPFPATQKEIELILNHGTLIPKMYNPKTNAFIQITSSNFNKLWNAFAKETVPAKRIINIPKAEAPKKEEPKREEPKPQQQQYNNNNKNSNKPKWEQKQEQKNNDHSNDEAPKKEEETFTVTTSDKK